MISTGRPPIFGDRLLRANPIKTKELEIRKVDGNVLVHDPTHDKVHVINRTAAYVLELCDGTRSSIEIARSLSDATGADLSVVIRDVDALLREFQLLQLLVTQRDVTHS
jgi:hypothetical protein